MEIKGVPRSGYAVKLVHNEGVRQVNLLKLRDELNRRGMKSPDDIRSHVADVSGVFANAERKAFVVRIESVSGLAQHPTQPDTTFLDELKGRIRVIACIDEGPIVLSGIQLQEFPGLGSLMKVREQDDVFVVFGSEEDCRTAADEIRLRFVDATRDVPNETRQALVGGYTSFERILPGPDRMYPDTDSPPHPR